MAFKFTQLNLPSFDIKLRQESTNGDISVFDPLRNRWLRLTPEEWVRQHFVNYLIKEKKYPASLIANEISLTLNNTSRRCDTIVYDKYLRPLVIVEYKAASVVITQKVFDQIARYNIVMEAPYLIVSNGLFHYCCKYDINAKQYFFLKEIPPYSEICSTLADTQIK